MTPNMISCRLFSLVFVVFLALCSNPGSVYAQFDPQHIRAVDTTATGNNDGTSWTDAYVFLKDALDFASVPQNEITQIWVAAGTYRPDQDAANPNGTGDRDATFLLDFNNIQVLGGFLGNEIDPDDRDPVANVTVLSGILGTTAEIVCGDPEAGACNVANGSPGCDDGDCCSMVCAADPVCCQIEWDSACVNLAAITCGTCGEPGSGDCFDLMGNGSPGCDVADCCALVCEIEPDCCTLDWDGFCAGLAVCFCPPPPPPPVPRAYHVVTADGVNSTVRLDGFTITEGLADLGFGGNDRGAGMFISNASPAVVRVTFTENSAPGHGGGAMNIQFASDPLVVNCSMTANDGTFGGAIHIDPAPASATLVNCLISGNTATSGGAIDARSDFPATLDLINCTVTDNTAQDLGGGIWVVGTMAVTVTNSIFWGNVPNQITGMATVTYSDVEGGWACPSGMPNCGNIDEDPLFVDAGNGDYRLDADSPCIDVGDPDETVIPMDEFDVDHDGDTDERTPDLDLNDRLIDEDGSCSVGNVDMGAYEAPTCCPWDMDNDGAVGACDLLTLLFLWGTDPGGPPDFDCSGIVGASDLLEFLFNWGPCPCGVSTTTPTIEQEMAAHCLTMDDWDKFVDKMQNGTEAEKENYLCWMTHYLEGCTRCICIGQSGCPGPDPFNG